MVVVMDSNINMQCLMSKFFNIHLSKNCLEYAYSTFMHIYVIIIWFPFDTEQETVCKNQDRHESFEVQMLNNVVDKSLKLRIFRLQR